MTQPHLTVELARGKSKPLWLGHPWVFSGAIHRVKGDVGDTGGPCLVVDERGNALGSGFYNPHGRISVRMLEHRRSTDLVYEPRPFPVLLRERLEAAMARRAMLGFPGEGTDAYRLVNAEGDLLPGLIVDVLGPVASVQLNARAMYEQRDLVAREVRAVTGADLVSLTVTETASRLEAIPVMGETYGTRGELVKNASVDVVEHGVRYRVNLETSQKTGFYVDQRENRKRFAELCGGQRVLDAYCYVGGFGISAALAGASRVTQVDSSKSAISQAQQNAELNAVDDRVEAITVDAVNFLKDAQARGQQWDRIVCDPPKLAQGRGHVDEALKKYARINTLAMGALAPGGLMLTCSCSRHVSESDFARMLTEAGHRLRKTVQIYGQWSQPEDHPVLSVAPEGRYLKAFLIGVS
ncbi:MAG: class I SAM-dependent rRNA methyltransferase [Deltaproteobacteria bacterium]|nr:MAG: class I SAM-dependent rRNA methyltransferase [Deltaproteobacteria bacterium]